MQLMLYEASFDNKMDPVIFTLVRCVNGSYDSNIECLVHCAWKYAGSLCIVLLTCGYTQVAPFTNMV